MRRLWAVCLLWAAALQTAAQSEATAPFPASGGWIAATSDATVGARSTPLPVFRRSLTLSRKVTQGTLWVTGLGQYEARVNGQAVTDAVLTPTWSDYRKRVFYASCDVTKLLVPGENVLGVMLGNGMYNVVETKGRYTKFADSMGQPKLVAELRVRYADGGTETIATDAQWRFAPGPIVFDSTYGGEDYDARLSMPGWDKPGFNASRWTAAVAVPGPGGKLEAETVPPVKAMERYEPVKVTHPRDGVTVYDLGENFAGWPEIEVTGNAGSTVKLLCGELLDEKGFVTQQSAHAFPGDENSFTYTLRGGGAERWHPQFSYWGFRYVQVEARGVEAPTVNHLAGRFLHDAVIVDGSFSSSSELLNRIHVLITRAMLSNMVGVLTDCPHREKLGWLEQTHLAASGLMYNYDLRSLYAKMGGDMEDAQQPTGLIPDIAPEFTVFGGPFRDSPEWGAAVILSPWSAYQFYGDLAPLRTHYGSMQRYAAYLKGKAQGHILTYGLGDWYDLGPGEPGPSKLTPAGLTATAIYYQSLTVLGRIATLLGHADDASGYAAEAVEVRQAYNAKFFHAETSTYGSGSQTSEAMPLVVGLAPEDRRDAVLASLVTAVRATQNHVTAGDVGFHYVVRALTDGGRSDVLYDMLSRTDKPSYGDQIAHGATTLTEAWDANPLSSQNHFMLGHAEEWLYRGLAGIDVDMSRAGAARIVIHPAVVGNVRSASASYQSTLGGIVSAWTLDGDALRMDVVIPAGTSATVQVPEAFRRSIQLNGRSLSPVQVKAVPQGLVLSGGTYRVDLHR